MSLRRKESRKAAPEGRDDQGCVVSNQPFRAIRSLADSKDEQGT